MSYVEMREIAGGVRELADTELAMVAGGGDNNSGAWWNVGKVVAGLVGGLIGGPFVGAAAAIDVIYVQTIVEGHPMVDPSPLVSRVPEAATPN